MKKYMLIVCVITLMFAYTRDPGHPSRSAEIKIHDGNEVEMCVSNFGKFGQTQNQTAGCWWPKGSYQNYIFGAGIWFGTVDSLSGDTLVTICYGPHGAETEVVPGLENVPQGHPDAIIYMYPETWPPPDSTFPMAPQEALSDEDSWTCFNDLDSSAHVPGDGRPIGLEFYQKVYVWDEPFIDDVIFFLYRIKNVSDHGLYDCYVGICTDNDVGNEAGAGDDQCYLIRSTPYFIDSSMYLADNICYQWDGDDYEPGWASVGTIGFDLLQTPFDLIPGEDKDNDGIPDQFEQDSVYYWNNVPEYKWDVDNDGVPDWRDASENPQQGMTAFKIFSLDFEPNMDPERYLTLAGYNFQNGQYEPFDTMIPAPDDQRFLMSTGPFDILPDSSLFFLFAVTLADYGDDASPPAETCLVIADHWAQWQYDMSWFLHVEEEQNRQVTRPILSIVPNPVKDVSQISFAIEQPGIISLGLYNSVGQEVKKILDQSMPVGNHHIPLRTGDLAQGMYFLVLETPGGKSTRSVVKIR